MRVRCPHCGERHDVAIRAVLAEADRLREVRNGRPAGARAADPSAPEVDGNTLSAEEIAERKQRRSQAE